MSRRVESAARLLLAARRGERVLQSQEVLPDDEPQAYAIQDATVASLGPVAGWKVGAKSPQVQPNYAPLPAAGIEPSGCTLVGANWRMRGIEVEVALRVSQSIEPRGRWLSPAELSAHFDAVLPVIEVVETRLADWKTAPPLAQLADLQSHGALVVGAPSAVAVSSLDLRELDAQLNFDGLVVARTRGGNPAADVWRELAHLALHCEQRRMPLRPGQIVTTGSCTGMLFASAGARVDAEIDGIGRVELRF